MQDTALQFLQVGMAIPTKLKSKSDFSGKIFDRDRDRD
jgi:hypothetical protein